MILQYDTIHYDQPYTMHKKSRTLLRNKTFPLSETKKRLQLKSLRRRGEDNTLKPTSSSDILSAQTTTKPLVVGVFER
jgi:hypothetical protein